MFVLFTVANQPNQFDGYTYFSSTYNSGLTAMVASLAGGTLPPTPASLYNAAYSFVQPLYYPPPGPPPPPQQLQNLNAMLGSHFDGYLSPTHPAWAFYSPKQLAVINSFLQQIDKIPVNKLALEKAGNFFMLFPEHMAISCLSVKEQAPVLIAVTLAGVASNYFYSEILAPSTNWATFIDPSAAVNFMNLRAWIKAAFLGSLIGATQSTVETPTAAADGAGIGDNLITTTTGALFATFGSIIFQWEQRPPMIKNCKIR